MTHMIVLEANKRQMYVHAVQSLIFNKLASEEGFRLKLVTDGQSRLHLDRLHMDLFPTAREPFQLNQLFSTF